MSIETALYATLSAASGVTALVSTRIYPNLVPEDTANPCIEYSLISGTKLHTLAGSNDMRRAVIQISCHADTYASAKAVADAVIAALQGNGYQQSSFEFYDSDTQTHTATVDWAWLE